MTKRPTPTSPRFPAIYAGAEDGEEEEEKLEKAREEDAVQVGERRRSPRRN